MSENTNVNPTLVAFSKSLDRTGKGAEMEEQGRAGVVVTLVTLAKEYKDFNPSTFDELVRHCSGINADGKKNPEAVKAAWDYFSTLAHEHVGNRQNVALYKLTSEKGTSGEDMSTVDRQAANTPIGRKMAAVRMAGQIIVHFDHMQIDWNDVRASSDNEALWVGRSHENQTMRRIYQNLKKDDTIRRCKDASFTIQTYGDFRFSVIAKAGADHLVATGVKRAPLARAEQTTPPRTVIANAAELIDKADSKSMDSAGKLSGDDELLKLWSTITNELSNGERKGFRISSKLAKEIIASIERERAVYDAQFKAAQKAA